MHLVSLTNFSRDVGTFTYLFIIFIIMSLICIPPSLIQLQIAIIDHISSCSAMMMPIKAIAKALHSLGVLVMIDGAHAPGQVHLNLEELGKIYISCH